MSTELKKIRLILQRVAINSTWTIKDEEELLQMIADAVSEVQDTIKEALGIDY